MTERWNQWLRDHPGLVAAALTLLVFVLYAKSLATGFVYDDEQQVVQNPFVLNPHLWRQIFTSSVWSFLGLKHDANFYRPLQFFSYWLVCRVAGIDPAAFHLYQLCFYAASVWLVHRIGCALFENQLVALSGAVLWAVHPLHVEAVVWIASLPDVGVAFFYLLGILLFLRAERGSNPSLRGHLLAALAYLPALFFKEMAITLPAMLLAWWFFCAPRGSWMRRAFHWVPYLAVVGIYLAIRVTVLRQLTVAGQVWRVTPLVATTALAFLGQHAKLFFWPLHLDIFRTFDLQSALQSPWPYLVLFTFMATLWVRRRATLLSFSVFWWGIALLPCLDYRQLSTPLIADRFSLIPSVGLCMAIAYLAWEGLPRLNPRLAAHLAVPALALLVTLAGARTMFAIHAWTDTQTLTAHALQQDPDAPVPHLMRGIRLQYRGSDYDQAEHEYREALRLNHSSFRPLPSIEADATLGLGHVAYLRGNTEEAIRLYQSAANISPAPFAALDALGSIYFANQDYGKAAEYFQKAVDSNNQDLGGRFYLGTCLMKLGKFRDAAAQFNLLRETDPTILGAYEAEANALAAAGDASGAERVRSLKPKSD